MIASGTQLGAYEILAPLGAGGMGEVYRARDTRLGREVAIKVLPQHLSMNIEMRARFEREASAIAALKHPNIVTIHSIEESAGVQFMVMELVEGRTIADVISAGELSLERFLEIAIPLADGVASAHAKGIVHRDLKPANILVDAHGNVKILDFGLAKLSQKALSASDETLGVDSQTRDGQILGTVAYMSPEQAEGLPVDTPSDVFSLGIVLYEMATGTNPFQRQTVVSTLSAILKDTPPSIVDLRPLPASLNDIVARCLEKSPAQRYRSAAELCNDLRVLQTSVTAERFAAPKPATVFAMLRKPYVAVPLAALLLAAIAGVATVSRRSSKTKWARQVALPEIERLLDATPGTGGIGMWQAFELGTEAGRYLPDDPVLHKLRDRYAPPMTLRTEPSGAKVYARPYAAPDTAWTLVGKTPIDSLAFVRGVFRVRIEKSGHEPTYDVFWNGFYDEQNRRYELKRPDQVPRGMVWVSGQGPRVRSDGLTEGVHLPGIEHLAPQELGDFFVDRYEVTNKVYKQFVDAGGYRDPTFWTQPFVDDGKTVEWKDAMARFTDKTQRPGPAQWEVGDFPDFAYALIELPFAPLVNRSLFPLARKAQERRRRFPSREAAVAGFTNRGIFKRFTREMIADYVGDGFIDTPSGAVKLACHPRYEAATFCAQRNHPWAALQAGSGPLILLRAEKHSTLSPEALARLQKLRPEARVATVEGAGHMLPMERPDRVRAAIEAAALMARRKFQDVE